MYVDLPNPFPSLPCIFNTLLPLVLLSPFLLLLQVGVTMAWSMRRRRRREEGKRGRRKEEKNREKRESAKKKSPEEQGKKFAMFYPFLFPGGGFWERQHLVSHTTTCVPRQEKVFFFLLLHHEGKCCRFHFPPLSFASLWEGAFPLGACCVRNKKNFWWREKESFHQIRNFLLTFCNIFGWEIFGWGSNRVSLTYDKWYKLSFCIFRE